MSYLKHYFLFGKAFLLHVSENSAKTYVLLDFSCNLSSCIWNIYTSFILKCQRIVRITPAYAGKSVHVFWLFPCIEDHPRLRGEKIRAIKLQLPIQGSPPPTRGKVYHSFYSSHQSGITPAYAGKRLPGNSMDFRYLDHPRLRGEKRHLFPFTVNTIGSPPPTRGKVYTFRFLNICVRITPAYAGKRSAL